MKETEDLLQERLERLEAGESLRACLDGLPEEEAELLKLVAALREAEYPVRDHATVAAQRAQLLKVAAEKIVAPSKPEKRGRLIPRLVPNWSRPLIVFSGALALLLVCAAVALVATGIVRWSSQDSADVVREPLHTPQTAIAQGPTAIPAPAHTVLLPMIAAPEILNPQSAALKDPQGLVQVQGTGGAWTTVTAKQNIVAGQRIRTGQLSSAVLAFYDGSQVQLGPDTEVVVEALDARPDGPSVITLTQWSGRTHHDVATANAANSSYTVRTSTATAEAKGTSFQVLVAPEQFTRFGVEEGAVAVTGQDVTVPVVAGQATTVEADQPPSEPAFRITGQGQVTQIGSVWTIAGQDFETHDGTIIVGNPQVGDWVFVEGRLLPDDTRVADGITLLHHPPADRFTLTGRVEAMGDAEWTVAGQFLSVDDETEIDDEIEIDDLVRVEGVILEDGTLLAQEIQRIEVEQAPGWPFEFTGVVQEIAAGSWTVSGVAVAVNDETEVDAALSVGDVAQVSGWILTDGTWLATEIKGVQESESTFEFTGSVESIEPWIVSGVSFETDEWTEIEAGIDLGDRVKVEGRILADGTWLATEVKRLDEEEPVLRLVFVGTVESIDPWIVSGLPLDVDQETVIDGQIDVGDLVRVEVSILPDGTWQVMRITLISDDEAGLGCVYVYAVVTGVDADQLELSGWPVISLDGDVPVEGEVTVGSVVMILVCVDADGTIHIERIIVIYQPEPEPVEPPSPSPPPGEGGGDKVTICHKPGSKNPRTITVSRSALQAHLNHGDTLGPCQ